MHEPAAPDFPVLKIRATGAAAAEIDEVSLGGLSLLGSVISIHLEIGSGELTTATLVLEVTPDVETPVSMSP